MKKQEFVLAEMKEKKSKHGNIYFEGFCEGGSRILMQKSQIARGEKIWKLFITK